MMSSGSTGELDPQFVKALGYLFSKNPDATGKLQKMLDDAIQHSMKKKQDIRANLDKTASGIKGQKHLGKITKSGSSHDLKKKEKDLAQKRQHEKIQKDLEELDHEVSKKARMDRASSSPTAFLTSDKIKTEHSSLVSSEGKDFALEIDDLACVICKGFSQDKGTPVECQECHNMYHRECHQPPISHQDTNDPRCVWYCSWCTKNMKKVAKQINSKPLLAASPNPVRDRINSLESRNKTAFVTPFKRNEMKATLQSSSNGSSGGSLAGWAALSGKSISATSKPTLKTPATTEQSTLMKSIPQSSSVMPSKEKRDKLNKPSKMGPKLAVSGSWAEALGADMPPNPSGSKSGSHKFSSKQSSSWGTSTKSSVFPKASAGSLGATKASAPPGANAEKRLQLLKKKAKLNPKKSKI